jgi:alpha-galactosidase
MRQTVGSMRGRAQVLGDFGISVGQQYRSGVAACLDQDPLGTQASVVSNAGGQWVLEKPLADGSTAVALFNAADTPWTQANVSLSSLGLGARRTPYLARDLWTGRTTVAFTSLTVGTVPQHGSSMVRISAP